MVVSYQEYSDDKARFLQGLSDWDCETSPMDENGIYRKRYFSKEPGSMACWYEVMEPVYETVTAEVKIHGVTVTLSETVKFLRTEYWSTADSRSKYHYELF